MNAQTLWRNAEHCLIQAGKAADEIARRKFLRAAAGWQSLALSKERVDEALLSEEPARAAEAAA